MSIFLTEILEKTSKSFKRSSVLEYDNLNLVKKPTKTNMLLRLVYKPLVFYTIKYILYGMNKVIYTNLSKNVEGESFDAVPTTQYTYLRSMT